MAPSLGRRKLPVNGDASTKAGIIAMITVVSVFCLVIVGLLVFKHYKQRQYHSLPQRSSLRSSTTELVKWKSNNTSEQKLEQENELQRITMIRKSLASRTSNHTLRQDTRSSPRLDFLDSDSDDGSRPCSLISEYKELEAGHQSDRAVSLENHPALKQTHASELRTGLPGPRGAFRASSGPSSLGHSVVVMPPPAVANPSPPPYDRQNRHTLQHVPPPRKAPAVDSRGVQRIAQPRRATFGVVVPAKRSATFDSVPEEYSSVGTSEDGVPGRTWI
ncbi:uncharacterized protein F5Z01DRAFT_437246 [Emericellopsis atlantica]|uniref:Uncharacterized protein n=1 Tax=Emericellopsis atlantica TaxID=2614577 RepID=A0A9P8CKF6_9HYPO|nr:uncharacterized protein F5Z01DRAFT_437246 [Emericellopsis atlantica]KAG9249885.1 hypothetical protein F5Z01DRAFT_437246 [Emericellopsis atlantica]